MDDDLIRLRGARELSEVEKIELRLHLNQADLGLSGINGLYCNYCLGSGFVSRGAKYRGHPLESFDCDLYDYNLWIVTGKQNRNLNNSYNINH